MKRSWVPWLGLAAVVVIAVAVLIGRSSPSNSPTARATRLENQLACPVCVGESVAESNAPESRAIRSGVVQRIAEGQTDAQIRAAFVADWGDRILLTPSNGGIGIVAWGLPVVAVLIGAAGIVLALRRWSITPRLAPTADDVVVVDRERRRPDAIDLDHHADEAHADEERGAGT